MDCIAYGLSSEEKAIFPVCIIGDNLLHVTIIVFPIHSRPLVLWATKAVRVEGSSVLTAGLISINFMRL